jgi:predicted SAM-dependent methyltransferase
MLEHLDYDSELPKFLGSAFASLQPRGTIRLIVPDAGRYLAAYMSPGWSELVRTRPLRPGNVDTFSNRRFETKMELINEVFRQGSEHKFAWDFETLSLALRRAGFVEIEQVSFQAGSDPKLLLDSPERAAESLYVEARKA